MPDPVLCLSTSFGVQVAGLHQDGRVWSSRAIAGRDHLAGVISRLDDVLAQSGFSKNGIHALLLDAGPGSFTGVRIAMTVGRTLAQALGLPVGLVTSLQALAAAAPARDAVFAVKDAGRGRIYAAGWRLGPQGPAVLSETCDAEPEEWLGKIFPSVTAGGETCGFAGDCVKELETLRSSGHACHIVDAPSAEDYFRAAELFRVPFGSWEQALPVYIRKSDAELKRKT